MAFLGNLLRALTPQIDVRIKELAFHRDSALGESTAMVQGFIKPHDAVAIYQFVVPVEYHEDNCDWQLDVTRFQWITDVPRIFYDVRNLKAIASKTIEAFRPLWMKAVVQEGGTGARIQVGQAFTARQQEQDAFAIFRTDVLALYRLAWNRLWFGIENRLSNDPEFSINGFAREDAVNAVDTLKNIFPWEWVRRRYRDSSDSTEVGMWEVMFADRGFPAYLLARTAIGCICKDPGWNYLITLADSCRILEQFPEGRRFRERIASNQPGYIHQTMFAAFLLKLGLLHELEPATGSGAATHDMSVKVEDLVCDIEMKTLTSIAPARQIRNEIAEKTRQIPTAGTRPLVFFVLLLETSVVAAERSSFNQKVASITEDVFGDSEGVSAAVIGQMFVDGSGGPVQWSFGKFLINERACCTVSGNLLKRIFREPSGARNYPLLPIVFTFNPSES